jgi:hypothetical protein
MSPTDALKGKNTMIHFLIKRSFKRQAEKSDNITGGGTGNDAHCGVACMDYGILGESFEFNARFESDM